MSIVASLLKYPGMLLFMEFAMQKFQWYFFSFKSKGLNSGYVLKENPKQQQLIQTQNNLF